MYTCLYVKVHRVLVSTSTSMRRVGCLFFLIDSVRLVRFERNETKQNETTSTLTRGGECLLFSVHLLFVVLQGTVRVAYCFVAFGSFLVTRTVETTKYNDVASMQWGGMPALPGFRDT